MSDMGALERLKTVAPEPENTDGGLGADIVWAVAMHWIRRRIASVCTACN